MNDYQMFELSMTAEILYIFGWEKEASYRENGNCQKYGPISME